MVLAKSKAVGFIIVAVLMSLTPAAHAALTNAQRINDSGQIVGYGEIGGQRHTFLLTPTPEPRVSACWAWAGWL